jgi:hypothetical protein
LNVAGEGLSVVPAKEARIASENLREGEKVLFGLIGARNQTIVALEERLLIIKTGFMAGATFGARVTSLSYSDITSIEVNTGLVNGVIEVCTPNYQGTKNKDFWSTDKDRDPFKVSNCIPILKSNLAAYRPYLGMLQSKVDAAKSGTSGSDVTSARPDLAGQLEALSGLVARSLLSDEEFKAAKQKLLGM